MTDIFSDGYASLYPEEAALYYQYTGLDPNTYIPPSSALFNPYSSISPFNPYISGAAFSPYSNTPGGLENISNFIATGDFANSFPVTSTIAGLGSAGASDIYQWTATQDPSIIPLLNSSPTASGFSSLLNSSPTAFENASNFSGGGGSTGGGALSQLNTQFFRFQNTSIPGTYLFAGEAEAASINASFPNFGEEGLAFKVGVQPGDSLLPFFRFHNRLLHNTTKTRK